jgi:EmrB/QacA subfamily drug resistance transporter
MKSENVTLILPETDRAASLLTSVENRRWSLLAVTISYFLITSTASSLNIALPSIGTEFVADAISLSWIATGYLLAAAMFLVPFGRLADIFGRKRFFVYGAFVFTIASLLLAISTSIEMLIVFRILQGIGAALIFATGIAILTSVYPAEKRGQVLGINVTVVQLGFSFGPFFGGLLTNQLGWRSIFLVNLPLGLIVLVASLYKLTGEGGEAKGERFDWIGSIIYGCALLLVMYGFSLLPELSSAWLILIGVIGIVIFVRWEVKVESPVLNFDLFRGNRTFTFSNLATLINFTGTYSMSFLLSLYLQYLKGLGPLDAGIILVSQPIVQAVFSAPVGKLSDRIEPRLLASLGMAVTAIALGLFACLDEATPIGLLTANLILLGFGLALFASPNTNAIMSAIDKRHYGVASAMQGTTRLIGQMLSMGIAALTFSVFMGKVAITPEYYPLLLTSTRVAFVTFAILCVGGIFASLARNAIHTTV